MQDLHFFNIKKRLISNARIKIVKRGNNNKTKVSKKVLPNTY